MRMGNDNPPLSLLLHGENRWLSIGGRGLEGYKIVAILLSAPILSAVSKHTAVTTLFLQRYGKEVPLRTIHVYRAARDYFIDGIYWEMTKKACGSISTWAGPPARLRRP